MNDREKWRERVRDIRASSTTWWWWYERDVGLCIFCDTMWVVRQADYPFLCFGAKPNKGLSLEIANETGIGGGKAGAREAREAVGKRTPERTVGKGTQREELAKGDAEKESRTDSRRGQSRWVSSPESTTVSRRKQWGKTSQDKLAFLVAL